MPSMGPPIIRGIWRAPPADILLGRLGRGARRGIDRARGGQRYRLVHPEPRALLRRLRPQADLGHHPAPRAVAAGAGGGGRHRRGGPARPERGRSRLGAVRHGRARSDRGRGVAASSAAREAKTPARLQGRGDAGGAGKRGGRGGTGSAAGARGLSGPPEGEGRRSRAPRHRHRRGVPCLRPPPARGDLVKRPKLDVAST